MKYFFLIIFILLLISYRFDTKAQANPLDSLHKLLSTSKLDTNKVELLNQLGYEYFVDNPQKAQFYAQQALELSQSLRFDKGIQISQQQIRLTNQVFKKQNNYFYLYFIGISLLVGLAYVFLRNNRKVNEQTSTLQSALEEMKIELEEKEEIIKHQKEEFDAWHNDLESKITERTIELQSAAESLLQRNKDLEEFSYIVSHNLRAPVANMLGLTSLFKNPNMQDDQRREILPYLEDSAMRLDTTIRDLSEVLSIRNSAMKSREMISLEESIAFIKKNLKYEIKENKAEILTDFSAMDKLYTVKPYLESILYNLISNSIKYRSPYRNPLITLKTYLQNGYTCLSISDNGLGIDLKSGTYKIFGLYQRMHTHTEGKGYGLYLVQTQVESLNGKIEVESEVDVGTTFKVYFKNN
jgi:signal transduction histidine kinase